MARIIPLDEQALASSVTARPGLAQRGADAAELDGDQRAEQTGGLERLEGLEGEPRAACRRRRPPGGHVWSRSWPPRGDLGLPGVRVELIPDLQSC